MNPRGPNMASTIAKTKDGIRRLNTKVYNENGHFAVQLYSTVVYDETANTLTLSNGGWITPTTTSRIEQALRHRGIEGHVFIKNGEMFFRAPGMSRTPFADGKCLLSLINGQVA